MGIAINQRPIEFLILILNVYTSAGIFIFFFETKPWDWSISVESNVLTYELAREEGGTQVDKIADLSPPFDQSHERSDGFQRKITLRPDEDNEDVHMIGEDDTAPARY